MPYLTYEEKKIYYEVHGKGHPLILLNGMMMHHGSWYPFLNALKDFQVIILDFLDQGRSDIMETSYDLETQLAVLEALVAHLKLVDITLVGVSYGGMIAQKYAVKHPLKALMLFNTVMQVTPWMKTLGKTWQLALKASPEMFYQVAIPTVYSHVFYNKHPVWMQEEKERLLKLFQPSFLSRVDRLIESIYGFNLYHQLKHIQVKTLVVGSELDRVTPYEETQMIAEQLDHGRFEIFYNCGHASVYEKSEPFIQCVKSFLAEL